MHYSIVRSLGGSMELKFGLNEKQQQLLTMERGLANELNAGDGRHDIYQIWGN